MRKAALFAATMLVGSMLVAGCDRVEKAMRGEVKVAETAYP